MANNLQKERPASLEDSWSVDLAFHVTDRETCDELRKYDAGAPRQEFACRALRLGVLGLRHVSARADIDQLRAEGDRLVQRVGEMFAQHQGTFSDTLGASLKEYFDPKSGHFTERVQRAIGNDGELSRLIQSQVGSNGSELSKTLELKIGESSQFMKLLDPNSTQGLMHRLADRIREVLAEQDHQILTEFSLDNKEGALSRLVGELTDRYGEIGTALEQSIDKFSAEFSLDHDDSALSRLLGRLESTQRQISSEFSLDTEDSALARMNRELQSSIAAQETASRKVHEDVRDVLGRLREMTARKEEAQRSTQHGNDFEETFLNFLQNECQKRGDIASHTGNTTGLIKGRKFGDAVVQLNPDHIASGAKIVIETKERAGYTLDKALEELASARKNRGASVGLFVFSSKTAPESLERINHYGSNVVIVWDEEDPGTDAFVIAGLAICRAMCVQEKANQTSSTAIDYKTIDQAILDVERQLRGLDEIERLTGTMKKHSEKVLNRARIMRDQINRAVERLSEQVGEIKIVLGTDLEETE